MYTVTLFGAGNVAFHLARAFVKNTVQVNQIYNRTLAKAERIGEANKIRYTDKISELEKSDIFIIASADKAIAELSLHIPFEDALVVHTSGSIPMSDLKGRYRKGVLYPLQTFTQGKKMRYDTIPFFIEAENEQDTQMLKDLALRISGKVECVNSEKRKKLHLAAVWACNFVNHMYEMSAEFAKEADVSFDYLRPLIQETALKIEEITPKEAQTGPAKRNDKEIIQKHLDLIQDPQKKQLYHELSESIRKNHPHEL